MTQTSNGGFLRDETGALVVTGVGGSLPSGGTAGQVLEKLSSTDGDASWATLPTASTSPGVFIVDSYGADPTGVADSAAAFLAAHAAAVAAGGGIVQFGTGLYFLSSANPVKMAVNLAGGITVRGRGRGATTIKCSVNVPSLLSNSSSYSAGDTFKNYTVEDLTVDANQILSGSHGVVFEINVIFGNVSNIFARRVTVTNAGTVTSASRGISINVTRKDPFRVFTGTTLNGATTAGTSTLVVTSAFELSAGMQFTIDTAGNAETLTVLSVSGTTVVVSTPTANSHASGVAIVPSAIPQNTITNIMFDECDFGIGPGNSATGGGATGVLISAFCNPAQGSKDNAYLGQTVTAADVFIDDIVMRKVRWRNSADPNTFQVSAGIQIVGDGQGGTILLDQCWVRGSGDVGYEIEAATDLTFRDCYALNCWNENFFLSNNHGGLPNSHRQVTRFVNCTSEVTNSQTLTGGFVAISLHASAFGHLIFDNCVHRHTAPRFLNSAGTLESNPSNGGFYISGQFRRVSFRNCAAIYDNKAGVATATNQTQTPLGIVVQQMGGTGVLDVDNFHCEYIGSADGGGFTGTAIQCDAIKIDYASRLTLNINGVRWRTSMTRTNGTLFRVRDVNLSLGPNTMTDAWATANTLTTQYLVDAGAISDLSQGSGVVNSVANHTTRKLLRVVNMLAANPSGPKCQAGKTMDGSIYVQGVTPAAGPSGYELISRLRVSDDGLSEIRAVLADDGSASTIRIEKVTAGTPTTIAGPTTLTRMTGAQTVGVRLKQQGNVLTADYFSSPGSPPVYTTAGTNTLSYTLTSGTEAQTWGADGVPGYVGWGFTPGASDGTLTIVRYDHLHVLSGNIDRLTPLGNAKGADVTNGLTFNANSTNMRFEGLLTCRGWNRSATRKDTPTDVAGLDATQKAQISVKQSTWAVPPAAGSVSLPASGVAYQNQDMVPEDICVFGGTLISPYVQVSRDGGTTKTQVAGATGVVVRLDPSDLIYFNYTVSTGITVDKVPVTS